MRLDEKKRAIGAFFFCWNRPDDVCGESPFANAVVTVLAGMYACIKTSALP
jgi:hypothetical protein